jgi:hypothetical protein
VRGAHPTLTTLTLNFKLFRSGNSEHIAEIPDSS